MLMSHEDWRGDIKPPIHNPQPNIPRKRSQLHETIQHPSTQPSETPELRFPLPTIPVFKLKNPRPDICVGLSDESIINCFGAQKGTQCCEKLSA